MTQPTVRIFEYDTAEIASPVGTRHIPGGSFAFKQRVALGCSTALDSNPGGTSGTLAFEGLKFEIVNGVAPDNDASKVTALTIGVAGTGSGISDLKLYLAEDTGLTIPANSVGQDPAFLQFAVSGAWSPGIVWASGQAERLTSTIPTSPNVFRQDGKNVLISNDDQNASQFIYLNLVVPWGFPLGGYGACGSGIVRLGLLFNFYNNDYLLEFGSP
jgi:hypothetical protein